MPEPVGTDLSRLARHVLQPGFTGTEAPDWVRRAVADGLGSVLLFGRNVRDALQVSALTAALHAENPRLVVAIDEEGGDVTRLEAESGSSYPGNLALGAVDEVELTERVARSLGRRLAAAGIDLDYAPDADVNSNPDNPVIGVRSFGAEPHLVARHVAAWVRGLQSTGTAACAKHFPGHGDTSVDSHLALPTVRMSRAQLDATALPPFRAAIGADVRAVMLGHLLLPALDAEHPASVSPAAVDLLRDELGFSGLIATDALEMAAVASRYGVAGAAVRALAAGADLLCLGHKGEAALVAQVQAAIVEAVRAGTLSEERLVEAGRRVLTFSAGRATQGIGASGSEPDGVEIGMATARRALKTVVRVPGALPLSAAPHHVAFTAAGPAALGGVADNTLRREVADRLPGTTFALVGECTDAVIDRVLADASGRPLLLSVRSAHRHAWMGEALARILSARPDAVVAELGFPGGAGPLGAAYLVAYGAGSACARAVAEALTADRS
ncbi:glycoside hydrolase family 3 protein [Actinospica durhamensis]|uniref:Glycoside hydrolase family 3 protein n=1 Tax=Actinospica durhamensis TaxID=1508375 RepID=A0A941ISK6_9ACTN|nr:glycoside hydrolase family 3 N-terminal domain-containing protein [Actinospica durhamensis]MBR7834988.1 glycoside hydrolase family 3 protein [Actinospica durhamensis]